jgi:hypothetical protein
LIRTTLELTPPAVAAEHMNWRVVGIPKTGATDSRPIAVGAVIVRCWSKALLPWLPEVPEGQWSERGVVAGAADWLATEGVAGGEVDLAKAFDTVPHEAAKEALEFGGTPQAVVAWMMASWKAPRRCHVAGDLAEPLLPCAGIPAGDPLCPRVLGVLLEPWTKIMKKHCPRVGTWAYLDDRSLKAKPLEEDRLKGEDLADAGARLTEKALKITEKLFDGPVGLTENKKKRQLWKGAEACEHLGLNVQAGIVHEKVDAGKPRGGWAEVEEVARRVALAPGPACGREKIATICVLPRVIWAAPLVEPSPWRLDVTLMRAILRPDTGPTGRRTALLSQRLCTHSRRQRGLPLACPSRHGRPLASMPRDCICKLSPSALKLAC